MEEKNAEDPTSTHGPPQTNGEGHAITQQVTDIRIGPYSDCSTTLVVGPNRKLYIWCQWRNEHGNWWFYGRLAETQIYGWMYSGHINSFIYDEDKDGTIRIGRC